MKKIISLILICMLQASLCAIPAAATDVTIEASDCLPGGQGIGFYDNSGELAPGTGEPEIDGSAVTLRAEEWIKYDITGIEEGTYAVSVKMKTNGSERQRVFLDLFADDVLMSKTEAGIRINTYTYLSLGKIYINDESSEIKLRNSGLYDNFYVAFESVTLEFIGTEDTSVTNIKIHAHNILSLTPAPDAAADGGYFDAAGFVLPAGQIIENLSYTQNAGDWSKYDISGIKRGTYSVFLEGCATANPKMSMDIDGNVIISDREFASTGSYSVPREDNLGMFYFDGTESFIRVSTYTAAIFLRGIRLFYESEENLTLAKKIRIEAENPIPGGQNEAYFDNGSIPSRIDVLEINAGATGSTICHRTGEWVKYSIKNLLPGKYALSISSASIVDVTLKVELDDSVAISEYNLLKQTSYTDFQTNRIGFLNIETSDEIIMKVSHAGGGVATYIDYFELTMVEPCYIEEFKTNTNDSGIISRGADILTVKTSNNLNDETYKNAAVYDSKGKSLAAVSAKDGKALVLYLKETLCFDSDYTIDLSLVTDEFGQEIEDALLPFSTGGSQTDKGTAELGFVTKEKKDSQTLFKGTLLSSHGAGIKGRSVTLIKTLPGGGSGGEETAVTDGNGNYEFAVDYSSIGESGAYHFEISAEYVSKNKTLTDTYYSDEANSKLCAAINGKASAKEAGAALKENEKLLGTDLTAAEAGLDMNYVYEGFINRRFTKASDISEELAKYILTEKINQVSDPALLCDIIASREEMALLDFDYDNWDLLTDESKTAVLNEIFAGGRISKPADMAKRLKFIVSGAAASQFGISAAAIRAAFPTVAEGTGGTVAVGLTAKTAGITKVHLELLFDDNTLIANGQRDVDVKIKHARESTSSDEKCLIIDIDRDYTLDDIEDIADITFTTLSGQAGSYPLHISGYAAFELVSGGTKIGEAKIEFAPASGMFKITAAPPVTGKNGKGGGGGGTISSYPQIPISGTKSQNGENTQAAISQPAEMFSDLDSVPWAKDAILTLAKMGIVSGRGDGTFDPGAAVTRAEFLKILFGVQNEKTGGIADFADTDDTDWYYPYVARAAEIGVAQGDENGYFRPNAQITREDMAALTWRLLVRERSFDGAPYEFADSGEIAEYAQKAAGDLLGAGILSGMGDNMFAPKNIVTRAQAAQLAMNILYPKPVQKQENIEKEPIGKRSMSAELIGDKLAVRTNYNENYDLVQQFAGFNADEQDKNAVINFSTATLTEKSETGMFAGGKILSESTDEATPFLINTSYIGANHGQSSGILVKAAHGKSYADIGAIYRDESGARFTLLKVIDASALLFLSENTGTSKTNYAFKNEITGNLSYVSDGAEKSDIKVSSYTAFQQILPSVRIKEKTVFAIVDGTGYALADGGSAACDYIDIVEKYDIINPATIGEALRKARPAGGYTENTALNVGETLIEYSMIYRITPDGAIASCFDHKIMGDINFRSYGGVQSILRNDVFGGGVHLYLPKTGEFTAEDGKTYDFSKPVNITSGSVPNTNISALYWDKEDDVPNREVCYLRDASGADVCAFAQGYFPVLDGAPEKRAEKTNVAIMLYQTKKLYPCFADAAAFSKTGTRGQSIKGAAYKKYADVQSGGIKLGTAYTVPYEDDLYVYIDLRQPGAETLEFLSGKQTEIVEKSDNVEMSGNKVTVTGEKDYGYLVIRVIGEGYGRSTYSNIAYGDKYTAE